jgi:hypothetical protein
MFKKSGSAKPSGLATPKKIGSSPKEIAQTMASAMGGGKGGVLGKLSSSSGAGVGMMEMLDKLPPDIKNKLMADRASKVAVKKGGKVSKAKPMKAKRKSTKTVKKQSGHNRLY